MNGVTPQALNYVSVPGFQRGNTTQTVVDATVSSNLGDYGITLPTAQTVWASRSAPNIARKAWSSTPTRTFQSGDLAGQGGPTLPVKGGYNVMDYFAEVRVPLVQDIPLPRT